MGCEDGSEGPSLGDEEWAPEAVVSPITTVGSPIEEEVGLEGSAECVPSTIPENRPMCIPPLHGVNVDGVEDTLVTVPLQFTAYGLPGRRGLGRRGRPRGFGRTA
ncbi:hypothetical protein Salat_1899200 [Sesamum alatum]|uniref:Uncharacterized protein n=1 Tax=Sesamum alatum TaxID=300844 RepID=A0AAE1Y4J3_9LAMI|nr:hypothetical protein Salat_1899200 [Sesamum alatum]